MQKNVRAGRRRRRRYLVTADFDGWTGNSTKDCFGRQLGSVRERTLYQAREKL
jgi:hypothetical protein